MTRRGNNEGTIRKRSDGRWEARISVNGRQRSVYGKTRDEVSRKLRTLQQSVDQGLPLHNERTTVAQFLEQWLETAVRVSVRPSTLKSYTGHIKFHIVPAIGTVPLVKLQPQHVQRMINALLESGLSPSTVLRVRATLRRSLNQAMKWGVVSRNVATLVTPPKVERFRVEPLTAEEALAILQVVKPHRLEALYTLLLGSGLRLGEALGLRWEDVDLAQGKLTVRFALQRIDGTHKLVAPKSRSSRRTVALPQFVLHALQRHRERQELERLIWTDTNALGLVFTTLAGRPLDGPAANSTFKRLLKSADLRPLRLHDLRHGYASLLLAKGVHARVVMELLGHSQISLTLDTYSHVIPALQHEAVDRLDELLPMPIEDMFVAPPKN
ncbi:MAG: site-specific integrase [Ardenticatenales bacterium]|nr:site-specific integrase [Ardenticatenales bacterium]